MIGCLGCLDCLNCYEKLRFKNHTVTELRKLVFVSALCIVAFSINAQNKYALIIGINKYYEVKGVVSEVSLHGSINDANSIRDLLIKKFGFKKSNIDTLYDGDATRDNIIAGIKKKLRQCKPGDAMVFYYSGHGVYLMNTQEDNDPIKNGMNQAMLTSDLYNYDDHLKCFLRDFTLKQYFNLFIDKKIILTTIFDCCFSGNLTMAARGVILPEQTKSVEVMDLLGRLTVNSNNPQVLIDSIAGLPTDAPKGCAVDAHGKIIDTTDSDGDGVPDCKDKELITPTICQPVDADGVGKCPEPQCCKDIKAMLDSGNYGGPKSKCNIGDLPSVTFKGKTVTLSKDAKALLASVAEKMRNNPNCKVAVVGYGESSKAAQQLSWDRVNQVITYLIEKEGISGDRFIFRYAQTGGDENTIDLKDGTGEEGPNTVPAPHPNLRKKK